MSHGFSADSPQVPRLELIIEQFGGLLHRYCLYLVSIYRDVLDPVEDADDLYAIVLMKVWKTYFAEDARQSFKDHGMVKTFALLKTIARHTVFDMVDKRQREIAHLRKHFRLVDLDAPIRKDVEDSPTFADFAKSDSNTALEVEASDRILEALIAASQNDRSPEKSKVYDHLLGERSREDLVDYSDGNIKVIASRVRKSVCEYLADS